MAGFIGRVPVPVCGVALAFAGIASLTHRWHDTFWTVPAAVSVLLLGLYALRCILVRGSFARDLSSPVPACVLATASMALQMLSQLLDGTVGTVVLLAGLLFQIALIANFSVRFLSVIGWKGLLATIFVPYVGVATSGISAPVLGHDVLGAACTAAALATAFPLMALVFHRYRVLPEVDAPLVPTACIAAAPFSICTVAMCGLPGVFPQWFVLLVYALALLCYAWVAVRLPGILRTGFMPSHASTTFPMVISSTATYAMSVQVGGDAGAVLSVLFVIQLALAVGLTLYVLLRMGAMIAREPVRA